MMMHMEVTLVDSSDMDDAEFARGEEFDEAAPPQRPPVLKQHCR